MAELRLERRGSPSGVMRALFRAPIGLYRAGLGFVLGKRFLMLEHTGRKTGETRRTVLEVVADHPDAVYVAAGWGTRSQWLKNVTANPEVVFHHGTRRYQGVAERVSKKDALIVIGGYVSAHPRAAAGLASFMLDDPGDTPQERSRRMAESVPVVRLPKTD